MHVAHSDAFVLHPGCDTGSDSGQFKVWLIYADFLKAKAPLTWPTTGEWAGGILAHFEVDWSVSPEQGCRGMVRQKRPSCSTGFDWAHWVVRRPGSDGSEAATRLSDLPRSR